MHPKDRCPCIQSKERVRWSREEFSTGRRPIKLSFYSERKISQSYMAYQASMTHFRDLTDAYILCNIKFVHSLQASKQCKGQGLSALTMFLWRYNSHERWEQKKGKYKQSEEKDVSFYLCKRARRVSGKRATWNAFWVVSFSASTANLFDWSIITSILDFNVRLIWRWVHLSRRGLRISSSLPFIWLL